MNKKMIVISILFLSLSIMPALSYGTVVLDQSYTTNSSYSGFGYNGFVSPPTHLTKAQTFTVGLAGELVTLEALLNQPYTSNSNNYYLDVLNTSGGVPTYSSLGTITRSITSLPPFNNLGWVSFDVSSLNIQVTPGEVLAIAFSAQGIGEAWWGYGVEGYSGGNHFYSIDGGVFQISVYGGDANFKTYVDTPASAVPEPATMLLLGLGLIGLVGGGRKLQEKK